MMMAAMTTMASSALVNDISGVWSKGETRLMSSSPRNAARMNTNRLDMKSAGIHSSLRFSGQRRKFVNFAKAGVHDFAALCDQCFAHDFVLWVDRELALFHHVQKKSSDVFG